MPPPKRREPTRPSQPRAQPRTQQDRTAATRQALLQAARDLFTRRGYADVPADEIVAAAGVSRGAMYHHFGDKRALFQAVFEQIEADIMTELGTALAGVGPDEFVQRGVGAFLDICRRPDVLQIGLTDAPAVLGWATWRAIEAQHGLGLITALLSTNTNVDPAAVPVRAQLVLSAVIEAALAVANADDREAVRAQAEQGLVVMLSSLLA